MTLDALISKITSSIQSTTKRVCEIGARRGSRITPDTARLMEEKRNVNRDSPRYKQLNKKVKETIRRDVKAYRTRAIEQAIEDNVNLRVLRSKLTKGRARIAFDSVETWAVLEAMDMARIDSRYSNLIKYIYIYI